MPGTGADRARTGRTGASPGKDSISVKRLPRGARVLHKQNAYQECLKIVLLGSLGTAVAPAHGSASLSTGPRSHLLPAGTKKQGREDRPWKPGSESLSITIREKRARRNDPLAVQVLLDDVQCRRKYQLTAGVAHHGVASAGV